MEKIFLVSLGCPKNLVDSESIMALLGEKGYILTDSDKDADIIIINTCAFLGDAVKESKAVIREFAGRKRSGEKKVIVCGCLVQRYGQQLFNIRGVNGIAGAANPEKTVAVVEKVKRDKAKAASYSTPPVIAGTCQPRLLSTYPYAYLKISEGCDNLCSYCLIPRLRGPLRSRKIKDIMNEAEALAKMGIKELILIAQDTSGYGRDLGIEKGLEKLLLHLGQIDFPRIRIMYAHPSHIDEGLLEAMAGSKNICRYLDIPLQHVHPEMLNKMNRPAADYGKLVDMIRKRVPQIALRTTFIVGFPGEKDEHFNRLLDFVKEKRFDRLGVFRYSREKGTAAYMLRGQVKKDIKLRREELVMEAQKKISSENLERFAGMELEVLIEGVSGDYFTGRTEFDAPEIDGTVFVRRRKNNLKKGDFCRVKILSSTEHDLFGIQA